MIRFFIFTLFSASANLSQAAANCSVDESLEGPAKVIECAAKLHTPPMTAENFWKEVLFKTATLDGYCNGKIAPGARTPKAQLDMFSEVCKSEPGGYFSYDKFISADEDIASRMGDKYSFLRGGGKGLQAYELKLKELANFLATMAQETKGGPENDTTDGLSYRYEASALQSNFWKAKPTDPDPLGNCIDVPDNPKYMARNLQSPRSGCPTLGLSEFKSTYYPFSGYVVAVKPKAVKDLLLPDLVNTSLVVDNDKVYMTKNNTIIKTGLPNLPEIGGTYAPPTGARWQYMNQTLKPAYWVGMGPLQLTEDSMTKFFGWYYQNLADNKTDHTYEDFQIFVESFLKSGKIAFEGALWYWNFRINAEGAKPIHCILGKSPLAACHDIGMTTYMTNGGCNDSAGRVAYYNYYKSTIFGLSNSPVVEGNPSVNSYECSTALGNYCQSSIPDSCN
jgi:hypothetical protein